MNTNGDNLESIRVNLNKASIHPTCLINYAIFSVLIKEFLTYSQQTAAAAMMMPIADAVCLEIFPSSAYRKKSLEMDQRLASVTSFISNQEDLKSKESTLTIKQQKELRSFHVRLRKLLYVSIAFSATIGGTSTLTSNGPNLVFKFVIEE